MENPNDPRRSFEDDRPRTNHWNNCEPGSRPVDRMLEKLTDVRQTAKGWTARCPAHDDRNPSLSISQGDDGRALVHCHTGCTTDAVCAAVGLRPADLFGSSTLAAPTKPIQYGENREFSRQVRDKPNATTFPT